MNIGAVWDGHDMIRELSRVVAVANTLSKEEVRSKSEEVRGVEVICVDDGSTDYSGAILDEYAAKDSRFKVIHPSNAGVSAARNAGLGVARGRDVLKYAA